MHFPQDFRHVGKLAVAFTFACCSVLAWPQTASQGTSNKAATMPQGKQIFSSACAQCHGLDGKGSERAPDIADMPAVQGFSDSKISQIIQNGVPGTGMPAFHSFDSSQIRALVAHLRMLQGKNKTTALPGDPEQGKALFFGKAGCSQCHMVAGTGGFIASDLSEYARIHEARQIRSAIVDPASSGEQARLVTVALHNGEKYAGRVRDEDNFSLQLQSLDGTFYFLSKSDIDKMQIDSQPLMPSDYSTRLNTHELNDVISYLIREAGGVDPVARKKAAELEYSSFRRSGIKFRVTTPKENSLMNRNLKYLIAFALANWFVLASCSANLLAQEARREFQLEANSSQFWSLIDRAAKLNTVGTGFGFTEGPVWDEAGFLYVSDETINKIYKLYPDGKKEELIALGDPDGNTYDRKHRLIDCASVLRAVIEVTLDGKYKILADHYQGKKLNTPNDVVVGPDGALYFTDPTMDFVPGAKQELPFQGVYRLDEKGNLQLLTKDLTQPNGLAFSPDSKHLYIDDSEQRNIRVYDVAADATLTNGRIFGVEPGGKGEGVPDGMKVDTNGNLYVVGPKGIWVWDAAGNHLGTIVMPEQPANLAWGDKGYHTLYITATTSVYRLETRVQGYMPYLEH